ncbi:class I glutamine amidotransferase-like protein [Stemphylium lycopersici]|nr:class I glutamine amidotransferase-like protein [Stemphylium lycopersici]
MRFTALLSTAALALSTLASPTYGTNGTNTTYVGPESGHLVIVGGNLQSEAIYQRIISLAGGPNASIVVIPTAGGDATYDQNFTTAVAFREFGATNVTVLHTYDPAVADTEEFIAPLLSATGVFFAGGDHTVGFGYLKNSAIDQHVLIRNRHFDMFEITNAYPELLGLAIDEDTALVVNKNEMEVIGSTYALVYDGGFWSREGSWERPLPPPNARFYFLREGDRYDLATREVIEAEGAGKMDDE